MQIEKRLAAYIVYSEDAISVALTKMNANRHRVIFCVAENGVLEGVITDGDFRRWVLATTEVNLNLPARAVATTQFVALNEKASADRIREHFSTKIAVIPLTDDAGRLVALAWRDRATLAIGAREVDETSSAYIICEIGNNHNGDFGLARRLIEEAAETGADCAKFQMRSLDHVYRKPRSKGGEDLGTEYTLDLLARFQLSDEELFRAFDYCVACGITPLCTPWDTRSLALLDEYGLEAFKIASADLTNHDLLRAACETRKPLIVSTGMSEESEIRESVAILKQMGGAFALLNCNSTYPTPMEDVHLNYMDRLAEIGGCLVGYSGHERGYEVPIAAVARGAKFIEKHITLDRNMEGNDHRVSLLPAEFKAMVTAIRNVEKAMGVVGGQRVLSQGERLNREVLAKSVVVAVPVSKGTLITRDMLEIRSPGRGLQPNRIDEVVGLRAPRDFEEGDIVYPSDLTGANVAPRAFAFSRPWGIPVRYHDFATLTADAPLRLVEIHFSYRDLDLDPAAYFDQPQEMELVVHAPELFAGDHLMDLSTDDDAYRKRSIMELQRVVDITRSLKRWFPATARPPVIINAGGFSADSFRPIAERQGLYERIADALNQIDDEGVNIIPQTMPPFPWHFGGQRYHNLFMDADEIAAFCAQTGRQICFDVSHSKLACNYFGWSMSEFVEKVASHTAHLHIVDARGTHDEGLQIGEGEIDFKALGKQLRQLMPQASFIPEIWQGHKNRGQGFWLALDRLEGAL